MFIILAFVLAGALAPAASAQSTENHGTVVDGVFTAAQAERGKQAYMANCSSCHMEDLRGQAGPALKGDQFMENWAGAASKRLFPKIQPELPQDGRGSLVHKPYSKFPRPIPPPTIFPSGRQD